MHEFKFVNSWHLYFDAYTHSSFDQSVLIAPAFRQGTLLLIIVLQTQYPVHELKLLPVPRDRHYS